MQVTQTFGQTKWNICVSVRSESATNINTAWNLCIYESKVRGCKEQVHLVTVSGIFIFVIVLPEGASNRNTWSH